MSFPNIQSAACASIMLCHTITTIGREKLFIMIEERPLGIKKRCVEAQNE